MTRYSLMAGLAAVTVVAAPLITLVSPINGGALTRDFEHIHSTMVGGHGPRLTDYDVATDAGIKVSKLSNPDLIPSMVFSVVGVDGGVCTASGCTMSIIANRFITSPTFSVAHDPPVYYLNTHTNVPYSVAVTPMLTTDAGTETLICEQVDYDVDSADASTPMPEYGAVSQWTCHNNTGVRVAVQLNFVFWHNTAAGGK